MAATLATAAQVAPTPVRGPLRTSQTKPIPAAPNIAASKEVFEVEARTRTRQPKAAPPQIVARLGLSIIAAAQVAKPMAMLPPRAFFSGQRRNSFKKTLRMR
mgnify:CR=1 FL=1